MKRRFRVKIHPAGIVIFASAFLFMDSHFALAILSALLLHEGAHLIAVYICGAQECVLELTPFGGMMDIKDFEHLPPWMRMVCSMAGVLANIACVGSCFCLPYTMFREALLCANLSLILINSLPLWPMDGARFAAACAAVLGKESKCRLWLSRLTMIAGTGLIGLGLYGVWRGMVNWTLLAAGPYLWYAARTENVSNKMRRLEGIDQKLCRNTLVPVSMWAGNAEEICNTFAARLGDSQDAQYQLVAAVDPTNGKIKKLWTEKEMLNCLLGESNHCQG